MEEILIEEKGRTKWELYRKRTLDRIVSLSEYKIRQEKIKKNTFLTDMSIDINEQLLVILNNKIKEYK